MDPSFLFAQTGFKGAIRHLHPPGLRLTWQGLGHWRRQCRRSHWWIDALQTSAVKSQHNFSEVVNFRLSFKTFLKAIERTRPTGLGTSLGTNTPKLCLMGGVCRLWNQHIAVNEPLRSQTCQAKFANCRCVCEPSNRICELPTRSLRTMTGVCEPKQVSRTSHEPKAVGTNFREWIYTILATIQTPFRLALNSSPQKGTYIPGLSVAAIAINGFVPHQALSEEHSFS